MRKDGAAVKNGQVAGRAHPLPLGVPRTNGRPVSAAEPPECAHGLSSGVRVGKLRAPLRFDPSDLGGASPLARHIPHAVGNQRRDLPHFSPHDLQGVAPRRLHLPHLRWCTEHEEN